MPDSGKSSASSTRITWMIKHWFLIFFLLLSFIFAFTFQDYGVTWDEYVQSKYGEKSLAYFTSSFQDQSADSYLNLHFYGPLVELISAVCYSGDLSEFKYEVRHVIISIFAMIAVIATFYFARFFKETRIAFLSVSCLLLMPRFYGHMFNNSKDLPFAALFIAALASMLLVARSDIDRRWSIPFAGLMTGLCLSIRVGGFLLFVYGVLILLAAIFIVYQSAKTQGVTPVEKFKSILKIKSNILLFSAPIIIIIIAWLIMVAMWPFAHHDIIRNPLFAFKQSIQFFRPMSVYYAGEILQSNQLPRTYLLNYIFITTPIPILVMAIFGSGICIIRMKNSQLEPFNRLIHFTLILAVLFPLIYTLVFSPNIYDGVRHFLFILPFIAILSAVGCHHTYIMLSKRMPNKNVPIMVLGGFILFSPVIQLITLHPYQMTYFNCITGGMKKAGTMYDTDYWSSSYKEAIEWINSDSKRLNKKTVNVLLAANKNNKICATYYADPHITIYTMFETTGDTPFPPGYDYYVAMTRYQLDKNFPDARIIHSIQRQGAVFTVIKVNQ
ncbi:hypothetical protein JYT61_00475 [bacterium AH-315-E10]|nr:hypothetical protein [bacterium AH-315-E10]